MACPHCGHPQLEPRTGVTTICKKCGGHYEVQQALQPKRRAAGPAPKKRLITCFECGTELEAPVSAQSTMCKRCSSYIDLKDYRITAAVSKNFKTKGTFTIEPGGYVFNTEALVNDAVIKGKFLGKLIASHTLTIHSTAEIKGTFKAGSLIIPAANHFRWTDTIHVTSAEISGELAANVVVDHTLTLKSGARLFGNVQAASLVMESGAVLVGKLRIGMKAGVLI